VLKGEETLGRTTSTWDDLREQDVRKLLASRRGVFDAFNVKSESSQWLCYVNTKVFLERANKEKLRITDPEIIALYEEFEMEDIMMKMVQGGGIQKAMSNPMYADYNKTLIKAGVFNHMEELKSLRSGVPC